MTLVKMSHLKRNATGARIALINKTQSVTVAGMHARRAFPPVLGSRLLPAAAALAYLILALGCLPGASETGSGNPAMSINRIAYIDPDGQLVTVEPDGTDRRILSTGAVAGDGAGRMAGMSAQTLSPDGLYSWPAWSPDGSRIAVSLISGTSASDAEMSVLSLESATGVGGPVFVNPAPLTIADGTPHYVQWSPDGRRLGITAATPEGLTLFVADANPTDGPPVPRNPVAVHRGAPLYFDWAPDSQSLAVHSGDEVSVLRIDDAFEILEVQPIARSSSFRTPAWSPDGTQLAWSAPGGDGEALWLGRPGEPGQPPLRLTEVTGNCAFLWSPSGDVIAVADRQIEGSPAFQNLRLIASDGSSERTVKEDDWVLGFFWEPGGNRLAWVALNTDDRTMEWRVTNGNSDDSGVDDSDSNADGDAPAGGLRFSPSGATFLMLAFFDQYARSHSPWAPDGAGLVVAGTQQYLSHRRNGSNPSGSRIYAAETAPNGALTEIGGGSLAVWSTR